METPFESLDNALEDKEVETLTPEDVELVTLGIEPKYREIWERDSNKPGKNVFYQGKLTKKFFVYVLDRVSLKELKMIKRDKLPENLQGSLDQQRLNKQQALEKIENGEDTQILLEQISKYEETIKEQQQNIDELYKKIQDLQEERDNLKTLPKGMYEIMNELMVFKKDNKPNEIQMNIIKEVKNL